MTAKLTDSERDEAAHVVALFSVLIHSWRTGDVREAARASEELERSGVKVTIRRKRKEVRREQ